MTDVEDAIKGAASAAGMSAYAHACGCLRELAVAPAGTFGPYRTALALAGPKRKATVAAWILAIEHVAWHAAIKALESDCLYWQASLAYALADKDSAEEEQASRITESVEGKGAAWYKALARLQEETGAPFREVLEADNFRFSRRLADAEEDHPSVDCAQEHARLASLWDAERAPEKDGGPEDR